MRLAPALHVLPVDDRAGVAPDMHSLRLVAGEQQMTRTANAKRGKYCLAKDFHVFIGLVFVTQREVRTYVLAIGNAIAIRVFVFWIETESLFFDICPAIAV